MIHRLTLRNFYSIRDQIDLDLEIAKLPAELPERYGRICADGDYAPKVVGVYGPNGAGKSTLLRALSFISWLIQNSFQYLRPEHPLPTYRFNGQEQREQPMEIGIEFSAPADLTRINDSNSVLCRYFYSVVLGGAAGQPNRIISESLVHWPPEAARRVRIFERDETGLKTHSRGFGLAGFTKPLGKVLRPNASLISTLVQLGHEPSKYLATLAMRMTWNILVEKAEAPDQVIAQEYMQNSNLIEALNLEIQRLDFGITKMSVQKSGNLPYPTAIFEHGGLASPLAWSSESHGTRQFVRIFPLISQGLANGGVVVIDELDSSIHPLILPEIIRWFYDPKRNPKRAQLWFTCQNPYLLTELTKEEIVFCEKDDTGCTSIFSLSSIKSVRRFDNYAKKYLGGAYGAVPNIG